MSALLAYVREGDVVIVAAIDRLGRNTIDVLSTVEALKAKGVSVVSMREGFDLATPAGKLMLTMLAAVAELERENLKGPPAAGLERARAEGKSPAERRPLMMRPWSHGVREHSASIKATAEHFWDLGGEREAGHAPAVDGLRHGGMIGAFSWICAVKASVKTECSSPAQAP